VETSCSRPLSCKGLHWLPVMAQGRSAATQQQNLDMGGVEKTFESPLC